MSAGAAAALLGALAAWFFTRPRGRRLDALRRSPGLRSRGPSPVAIGARRAGGSRRPVVAVGGRRAGAMIGRRWTVVGALLVAPVVLAIGGAVLGSRAVVLSVAATIVAGMVTGLRRRAWRRAEAAARRDRVIEACGVLASDLRAGRVPVDALDAAATVCPELDAAVSEARLGGDVPATLDRTAALPGASGLRALGAAWRVAEQSGTAFAGVAERVAEALRGDELVRRQVSAGLAGARATGRLLAGLPVLGLGLGHAVGADPVRFLTGNPVGWLCLLFGLLLAAAGLAWVERLADSCEGLGGGAS